MGINTGELLMKNYFTSQEKMLLQRPSLTKTVFLPLETKLKSGKMEKELIMMELQA